MDEMITNNDENFKKEDKNLTNDFTEDKFEDIDDDNYDESIYDLADLINDLPGMEVMGAGLEDESPYLYFKCDIDEGEPFLLILSSALWISIFPDEEFNELIFSVEMPENEEEREKYISGAYDEITSILDEDDMEGDDFD